MRRALRFGLGVAMVGVVAILLSLLTATGASARVGDATNLPFFNATGSVSLTSANFAGRYTVDYRGGDYCVYLQYKHVARLGLDATWNRLTTGNSCGVPMSGAWSAPTDRAFNGIKFRICQDKPNAPDPCGGDVTLYR